MHTLYRDKKMDTIKKLKETDKIPSMYRVGQKTGPQTHDHNSVKS